MSIHQYFCITQRLLCFLLCRRTTRRKKHFDKTFCCQKGTEVDSEMVHEDRETNRTSSFLSAAFRYTRYYDYTKIHSRFTFSLPVIIITLLPLYLQLQSHQLREICCSVHPLSSYFVTVVKLYVNGYAVSKS